MSTCDSLLHALCHGSPDGRPLYAYRISDDGYADLRAFLVEYLRTADPARLRSECCALFCLFVAEHSRRDPEQAGRLWGPVRSALGIDDVAYPHLITWVVKGLRHLDRGVQSTEHHNLYRVTLGCEGGLALERIATDDQGGERIRRFFRALLARFAALGRRGDPKVEDLAEDARRVGEEGDRLPRGLQNEVVYSLAGQLAGAVWSFRQAVRDQDDPVAALDRLKPGWRDQLPVVLSGQAADQFVRGLLVDTRTLAQGQGFDLEVRTELRLGARPRLIRTLHSPRDLTAEQVRTAFPDLPLELRSQRFVVRVRSDAGDHARVGILRQNADSSWTFQPQRDQAPPSDQGSAMVVELASRRDAPVRGDGIGGCDELGPLPWVFQDEAQGGLLGTGSVRHASQSLIVAVPPGARVEAERAESLTGEVAGRALVRVQGTARIHLDDEVVHIRTATPEEGGLYELRGRLLHGFASTRPVWRGLPRLERRSLLGIQTVDAEVRAIRGQVEPPAGDLEIRLTDEDGALLFKRQVRVVPADTSIAVTRVGRGLKQGLLTISAAGLREVAAPVQPPLTSQVQRRPTGEFQVAFAANSNTPPTRSPLTLDFEGATLRGSVVLPLRTLRFEALDGEPVPADRPIHLRHLGRYRAVGVSPHTRPRIQVRLELQGAHLSMAPRTRPLRPTHRHGPHQLDLAELNQIVLDLLNQTPSLDARVRITLEEIGEPMQRPVRLTVRRYDWNVQVDRESGDVCLLDDDIDEETLEALSVEARPFADIARAMPLARLRSSRLERPTWTFQPRSQAPGSYLLLVSDDGWYRCRPTVLIGTGPGDVPTGGLAGALQIASPDARLASLAEQVRELTRDPEHADWALVEDYLSLIGDIPPATFDLVRVVAEDPSAPAHCAVRLAAGKEADFLRMWDGLQAVGVLWEAVPVDAWWEAFDQLQARLEATPLETRESVVRTVRTRLEMELGTVRPIAEAWCNGRRLEFPQRVGLYRRDEHITQARQRLADADWPRAPDERFVIDPDWTCSQAAGHADMRVGLSATTALAQAAVFDRPLSAAQRLYLAELRTLDEPFFRDSTFFATCALLAARTKAL